MEENSLRAVYEGHCETIRGENEICIKIEKRFRQQNELSVIRYKKVTLNHYLNIRWVEVP